MLCVPSRRAPCAVRPLTKIPADVQLAVDECECHRQWERLQPLGRGAYGTTYRVVPATGGEKRFVVKIQPDTPTARRELRAYARLSGKTDVVPRMHAAWICRQQLYIVLDELVACKRASADDVDAALAALARLGWLHVDVHAGNIMCSERGEVRLVDLGWAVHRDDAPFDDHPTGLRSFGELETFQRAMARRHRTRLRYSYTRRWAPPFITSGSSRTPAR